MSTVFFFFTVTYTRYTQQWCRTRSTPAGIRHTHTAASYTVAAELSRSAINRTMDIHRSSMANCVQFAINRSL